MTAQLLTEAPIEVVPDLREHVRHSADWIDDFGAVVRRAFAEPDVAGVRRVGAAGAGVASASCGSPPAILATHADDDVVLVGHGTAWTCLVSALRGAAPDLDAWARLAMPDLIECAVPRHPGDMLAP